MEASWWGCFKGVSSLSDLRLAGNVDDLLDDVNGLVGFCLVPESDDSSYDASDESSEDDALTLRMYPLRTGEFKNYEFSLSIQTYVSP